MNILITGCLGDIGSSLLPKLLKKNYNIFGIDSNINNNLNTIFNLKKKFTFFLEDLKKLIQKKN